MKIVLTTGMILLCQLLSAAQSEKLIIRPGMKAPNIFLKGYLDSPAKRHRLLQFKGELLILDFWNTSCSSCILAMPEMDSLQKQFGDRISIVLVTRNSAAEVKKLFSRITIPKPGLPMIVSDNLLEKYFPHGSVPHHVWIDKNGVVRFITDGYNTSEKNVVAYLSGKELNLHYKNEDEDFDFQEPLLSIDGGNLLKNLQQYSMITNRIDEFGGSGSGLLTDSVHQQFGIKLLNTSMLEMYKTAFGEAIGGGRFSFDNRIVLEVGKPERFRFPTASDSFDNWITENMFGYEARIRNGNRAEVFALMRRDLAFHFPYRVYIEFRRVKSFVLMKIPGPDLLGTKNPNEPADSSELQLKNMPFTNLIQWLRALDMILPFPFSSEFEYEGRIDFEFPDIPINQPPDIDSIRKALNRVGLDLIVKEKLQEMLIIHDR